MPIPSHPHPEKQRDGKDPACGTDWIALVGFEIYSPFVSNAVSS